MVRLCAALRVAELGSCSRGSTRTVQDFRNGTTVPSQSVVWSVFGSGSPGERNLSFPVPRELLFLHSIASKSVLTSNGTKLESLPQRRGPGNHIPATSSRVSPLSERPERLVNCQVPQNCWPLTQPRKYR